MADVAAEGEVDLVAVGEGALVVAVGVHGGDDDDHVLTVGGNVAHLFDRETGNNLGK